MRDLSHEGRSRGALMALLALAMVLAGCRAGAKPPSTAAAEPPPAATGAAVEAEAAATTGAEAAAEAAAEVVAARGYDLFSWEAGGAWNFALLPDANRLRSFDEIRNAELRVQGVAELKSKLRKLPRGEKVSWSARVVNTAMPADEVIDDLSRFCAQLGLELTVSY